MTKATDRQVGGDHYKTHKFQPWDIIDEYNLNFYEGCILKYLLRRKGDRVEDLQKLGHCNEKLIENLTKPQPNPWVEVDLPPKRDTYFWGKIELSEIGP